MVAGSLPSWCRIVRDRKIVSRPAFVIRDAVISPRTAAAILIPKLGIEEVEVFVTMLLDAQHKVIAMQEVTRGLVNSTMVHPREVFRMAIAFNASALVVAHNHPSNLLEPSSEDRSMTKDLVAAGDLLGIPLHDHLIVGSLPNRWYSFSENGLI